MGWIRKKLQTLDLEDTLEIVLPYTLTDNKGRSLGNYLFQRFSGWKKTKKKTTIIFLTS